MRSMIFCGRMMIIFTIAALIVSHCERKPTGSENPSFQIEADYTRIRSYPGGGGVFLVRLIPDEGFSGEIFLSVDADSGLHPDILENPIQLDDTARVAEICIWPDSTIPFHDYGISLTAADNHHQEKLDLQAEIIEWDNSPPSEDALFIRNTFMQWFRLNVPDCEELERQQWKNYMTYPQILVVEHWTSISPQWEIRFCIHVMIAPYDWSMARLRPRGKTDPLITVKRESGGDIHTIPVEEYPVFEY